VKVGNIVLIHDDTPGVQWKLAVMKQVNKGADGLIRSANVRKTARTTNQPVARLYSLGVTAKEEMSKPTMVFTVEQLTSASHPPQRPAC